MWQGLTVSPRNEPTSEQKPATWSDSGSSAKEVTLSHHVFHTVTGQVSELHITSMRTEFTGWNIPRISDRRLLWQMCVTQSGNLGRTRHAASFCRIPCVTGYLKVQTGNSVFGVLLRDFLYHSDGITVDLLDLPFVCVFRNIYLIHETRERKFSFLCISLSLLM